METIPLDLTGPRPIAMLTPGSGAPVRVIFDTGAGGNVLEADFARGASEMPLDGALTDGPPARLADGVPRAVKIGRIRGTARVGTLVRTNPEVRFMVGLNRVNVGMLALRGATIVVDPAEGRAWLIPPAAAPANTAG